MWERRAVWKVPVPRRVSSSSSTERGEQQFSQARGCSSWKGPSAGPSLGRGAPHLTRRVRTDEHPPASTRCAPGGQKSQAFKRRRRDLRPSAISAWHDFPAAHHSGTEAREIDGRSGLAGGGHDGTHVIPNSVALILHRQQGLRRRDGLEDKQIILPCLAEEHRPLGRCAQG